MAVSSACLIEEREVTGFLFSDTKYALSGFVFLEGHLQGKYLQYQRYGRCIFLYSLLFTDQYQQKLAFLV